MTREVKIGTAVAGSFLSLVGIVVGTKVYKGDIPKTVDGIVASADLSKVGDLGVKPPESPPGILPTGLTEMPSASFPPPSPPGLPQLPGVGSSMPPAPPFPDPKGFTPPSLPDLTKPFVDAGDDAAKKLQDTIALQKKGVTDAIGKTTNDLNSAANSIINSANTRANDLANEGKNAVNGFLPKDPGFPTPPSGAGNPSLPAFPPPSTSLPPIGFPNDAPVTVAQNTLVGGKSTTPPPPTSPTPAPNPAPLGLPGVPDVPLPVGSPPSPPVATPPGGGLPPLSNPPVSIPPATPIVGDPLPKPGGSLPPIGNPPGSSLPGSFPTPPSPPAGNPFPTPPAAPVEPPSTPIVGAPTTPAPAPPGGFQPNPSPNPFGTPAPTPPPSPSPFGSPTPPPAPFGSTPPAPPAPTPNGGGFVPVPPTPPMAAPGQPQVKTDTPERYQCQGADTFASLSARKYGSENFARALEEYNRDMPGAADNLRASPARLFPGTVVWLPSQNYLSDRYARFVGGSPLPPTPVNGRPLGSDIGISPPTPVTGNPTAPRPPVNDVGITTYRVPAGGQYFSQIAEARLGSPLRWIDIYRLNVSFPPEQPIREGTEIRIPVK